MLTIATAVAAQRRSSIYDFTMRSIDGQQVSLKSYSGKVVLLVNVASKCGFTPQYAGLEAVYEKYRDRGLVVVGFPANRFIQQEPGTNEEIKKFCSNKYNVSFPMMSKVSVLGDDETPLDSDQQVGESADRRRHQVEFHQVSLRPQWQSGGAV